MRHITGAVLALLVVACQTAAYEGNENSPYYLVPAGSRLILNRAITIPANAASVHIQDGDAARSFWDVRTYYPYCTLEVRRRLDVPQTVQADDFTITRVSQETRYTAHADFTLPDRLPVVRVADMDGDGAPHEIYATRMMLRSERQPDVLRLTCAQWGYPPLQGHVTINEMRKTLGNLFTLRLAGKGDKRTDKNR